MWACIVCNRSFEDIFELHEHMEECVQSHLKFTEDNYKQSVVKLQKSFAHQIKQINTQRLIWRETLEDTYKNALHRSIEQQSQIKTLEGQVVFLQQQITESDMARQRVEDLLAMTLQDQSLAMQRNGQLKKQLDLLKQRKEPQ